MSKAPRTAAGRVIGMIPEITEWFRQGWKHGEVLERLGERGITLRSDYLREILTRYGVTERKIRRTIGRVEDAGPDRPAPRSSMNRQANGQPPRTAEKASAVNRHDPRADLRERQTTGRHKLTMNADHTAEDVIG